MELSVLIEIDGEKRKVGRISGTGSDDAVFSYDDEYLDDDRTEAISLSLPKARKMFSVDETKIFFDALLPEGFTRRAVAGMAHIDENDYISILRYLGRDCIGAIQIIDNDEEYHASYEEISADEISKLAKEGATKSSEMIARSRLSLAGASGKVGLYFDEKNGIWYLPQGTAPSTHIVKQSHVRLEGIVTNEQLVMLTAKKCGIEIPESFIINTGTGKDEEILFVSKRYDRSFEGRTAVCDGLELPMRLHQEDFSQAMGISSSQKYEISDEGYLKRMFSTIRSYASDPVREGIKLWKRIVFNYLVGNTDSHIKNYSLLYSHDLAGISLAPAYDMVSTVIYESCTKELSIRIGNAVAIDEVNDQTLAEAAGEAGLSEKIALRIYYEMKDVFEGELRASARELKEQGFRDAGKIADRILLLGSAMQ